MPTDHFAMPLETHTRKHSPGGYLDYERFKPWLRDEFQFRCVYCMWREKWDDWGYRHFHVDHRVPKSVNPDGLLVYGNLIYSCDRCNIYKNDEEMPDPCVVALGLHYKFNEDGSVQSVSGQEGQNYIEILGLDEPENVDFRARWFKTLREFWELYDLLDEPGRSDELARWFGYPIDIPDLRRQRPPNKSRKSAKTCYYVRLSEREIPNMY